ncbi:hypothetical protein D3C73_1249730 [compost metagenome]
MTIIDFFNEVKYYFLENVFYTLFYLIIDRHKCNNEENVYAVKMMSKGEFNVKRKGMSGPAVSLLSLF